MGKQHNESMGILEKRRIEASIIKPIYEVMKRELGQTKAQALIAEAIKNDAINQGREMANNTRTTSGEPLPTSIATLVAIQPLWTKEDALQIEPISQSESHLEYRVTRCRYAEMYHEMGLAEIGYLLSCNRDLSFIEGYAPQISLDRPHTLMQGDHYCDFHYQTQQSKTQKIENRK